MTELTLKLYLGLILVISLSYFLYLYLPKLVEAYQWYKIKNINMSDQQKKLLKEKFKPYNFLSSEEQKRLEKKILFFLNYKNFYTIQDFRLNDDVKLIIAAQACLLIVNLKMPVYPKLKTIYVGATPFIEKDNYVDLNTLFPAHVPRLGESWKDGPVVLAWSSVKAGLQNWNDGHNVVLHEFAHQLDALDGHMDGTPILEDPTLYSKWEFFMTKEFINLRKRIAKHQQSYIDNYGGTNEAEFFAVVVEQFFSKSKQLHDHKLELYNLLKDYFKLDPILWS